MTSLSRLKWTSLRASMSSSARRGVETLELFFWYKFRAVTNHFFRNLLCVNTDYLLPGMSRLICVLSTWRQHHGSVFLEYCITEIQRLMKTVTEVPSLMNMASLVSILLHYLSTPSIIEAVNLGSYYSCLLYRRLPTSSAINKEAQHACTASNAHSKDSQSITLLKNRL